MPREGENDHEKPIALCKRKGICGYDADPDVRRRSCAISGNSTLGSVTGLSECKSWRVQNPLKRCVRPCPDLFGVSSKPILGPRRIQVFAKLTAKGILVVS